MKKLQAWMTVFLVLQVMTGQSQTETLDITSKVFNETRKVKVALPQGYNDDPSRKFMVAWLFDAQSGDFFPDFINRTPKNHSKRRKMNFCSSVLSKSINLVSLDCGKVMVKP